MFPISITLTINNQQEFDAVHSVVNGTPGCAGKCETKPAATQAKADKPEKVKETTEKKSSASTDNAATTTTAAATDAPEKKAESSDKPLENDVRQAYVRKAIAAVGRDKVVSLIAEYGVSKATDIQDPVKLAELDRRIMKLAGE